MDNQDYTSIYDDVSNIDLGNKIHKVEDQNRQLLQHIRKLENEIEKLSTELSTMKEIQQNLSKNISELYKTAKLEIQRKDRIISELRQEIDKLILKKGGPARILKREICNEEEDRIYRHHDNKRFKNDFCGEQATNSAFDKKMYNSRSTPDLPGDNPQFKLERISCERDHKHFKNDFCEEHTTNSVLDKKMHNSRSTPDKPGDNPQFKLERISCERDMDYKNSNNHRYNSRYPLQRDNSKNGRLDRYNKGDPYNNRFRRGRSPDRFNRNNRSRSIGKRRRSTSRNKYRRSLSSNKFRRSRSSNRSDDINMDKRSIHRDEYLTSKSSKNKNVYNNDKFTNRNNCNNENYNDEKMLHDIKSDILNITELEEGEITAESDNNLIIEDTNMQNLYRAKNTRSPTSSSGSDLKAITIEEYRTRTKVTSTVTTIEKTDLKLEENNTKNVQLSESKISDSVKQENFSAEPPNKDIPGTESSNNSMNEINIDIKLSNIIDNASTNTSICSNSSENTSLNTSASNSVSKIRRRRCVVIGFKDKV